MKEMRITAVYFQPWFVFTLFAGGLIGLISKKITKIMIFNYYSQSKFLKSMYNYFSLLFNKKEKK